MADPGVQAQFRYGGYGRYDRYRRHRGGVDAGDVVAGVLVLGTIAAIASAAGNRDRDRYEYRDRDRYPPRDDGNYYRRGGWQGESDYGSDGMDRAVDMCVAEVESRLVGSVDEARRTADGWHVAGQMRDGEGWRCWIDNDGRVQSVDRAAARYAPSDDVAVYPGVPDPGQLDDEVYARARAAQTTPADRAYSYDGDRGYGAAQPDRDYGSDPQPAYPGGPLPGEEGYDDGADGYTTARAGQ
ncbi:hypothetical protein EG799_03015 [Aurantiacibacter spongiae]|uniref:Uncharacterized protein n=1 Tax=Aurantiacibacter spongiae TaxID=2488860 RepID=A0A3N5D0X2_9SPHN|nr:hypothetical protein EG799_03015 [Aurantiacibacter spongiae]